MATFSVNVNKLKDPILVFDLIVMKLLLSMVAAVLLLPKIFMVHDTNST